MTMTRQGGAVEVTHYIGRTGLGPHRAAPGNLRGFMERREPVVRVPGMRATPTRAAPEATDSFESFYRGQVDTIYRALALTITDHGLAREATDEAMLRAYVQWSTVGGYESPSG